VAAIGAALLSDGSAASLRLAATAVSFFSFFLSYCAALAIAAPASAITAKRINFLFI
jgi:hypothetical protein